MAENLRQRRQRLGLTQEELARALFVDRMSISGWERGTKRPALPGLVEEKLQRMEAEAARSARSC